MPKRRLLTWMCWLFAHARTMTTVQADGDPTQRMMLSPIRHYGAQLEGDPAAMFACGGQTSVLAQHHPGAKFLTAIVTRLPPGNGAAGRWTASGGAGGSSCCRSWCATTTSR